MALPAQSLNFPETCRKYPHLKGLPISSYHKVKPSIILGLDHVSLLYTQKDKEGKFGEPIGTKTRLGWCLYGPTPRDSCVMVATHFHQGECMEEDRKLEDLVRHFYIVESMGIMKKKVFQLTAEEQRANAIMESTTQFLPELNRYQVGLLWRSNKATLPDSFSMALSRMK